MALDAWLDRADELPPIALLAALDWTAHVTTTAIVLRALPEDVAAEVADHALAASLIIDLDHVPIAVAIARGEELPRPRPHTFLTPLVLGVLRRRGAALGTAVHLARDLFNGPGVAVVWPAHERLVRLPVAVEAALLAGLLLRISAASR